VDIVNPPDGIYVGGE